MKWLVSLIAFAAVQVSFASPLEKRASVNDVANIGYATLNGGTSGGSGGTTTTVTTLAALTAAVSGTAKKIVIISGTCTITGDAVVQVGSNTSVLGAKGAYVRIVLNYANKSTSYDGLLDITHGCTGVTVSYSKLSTHWKASLVGHSDSNGSEDAKITVTFALNNWSNLNSRTPSFRFGTGHIFNNIFDNNNDGINTRKGAQLLVENNVWTGTNKPLYSTDGGFAVATGNDFGGASNTAPLGTFTKAPYSYNLLPASSVRAVVASEAGQTLSF
ncbi:hypothetical protein H0H81_002735 [Sphagnurus paluster]|uniref:Pectate lyase domain-containing protein n=1 Tax=Sphagnurus paluster TaxID=117069 RepID=A0A9P7FSR2_9AGAR|nr:hypothetical protein H0H81_002735 [Sphagnurus paluster]